MFYDPIKLFNLVKDDQPRVFSRGKKKRLSKEAPVQSVGQLNSIFQNDGSLKNNSRVKNFFARRIPQKYGEHALFCIAIFNVDHLLEIRISIFSSVELQNNKPPFDLIVKETQTRHQLSEDFKHLYDMRGDRVQEKKTPSLEERKKPNHAEWIEQNLFVDKNNLRTLKHKTEKVKTQFQEIGLNLIRKQKISKLLSEASKKNQIFVLSKENVLNLWEAHKACYKIEQYRRKLDILNQIVGKSYLNFKRQQAQLNEKIFRQTLHSYFNSDFLNASQIKFYKTQIGKQRQRDYFNLSRSLKHQIICEKNRKNTWKAYFEKENLVWNESPMSEGGTGGGSQTVLEREYGNTLNLQSLFTRTHNDFDKEKCRKTNFNLTKGISKQPAIVKENIFLNISQTEKLIDITRKNKGIGELNLKKIEQRTGLGRREIIEYNQLFQILRTLQLKYLNSQDFIEKKGLSFITLYEEVPQIRNLGIENAMTFYSLVNKKSNGFMVWDEFLEAMNIVKARSKMEKMTLFSILADIDGNKSLSYDEILFIAKVSLKQNFKFSGIDFENDKFFIDLSESFCRLVFQICNVSIEQEIEIDRLFQVVKEEKMNSDLILFFCGAD